MSDILILSMGPVSAQRCRQETEDRPGEDGEEGTARKGEVPGLLWNYDSDRGNYILIVQCLRVRSINYINFKLLLMIVFSIKGRSFINVRYHDRKATVTQITTRTNPGLQNTISEHKTSNFIAERRRQQKTTPSASFLSADNRKLRLQFAHAQQNWKMRNRTKHCLL